MDDTNEQCSHELVSTQYLSATYGHCIECDCTVVKDDNGNWKLP